MQISKTILQDNWKGTLTKHIISYTLCLWSGVAGWMDGSMAWEGMGTKETMGWTAEPWWMDDLGKELPLRIFQILTRTLPPGFTGLYVRDSGLS